MTTTHPGDAEEIRWSGGVTHLHYFGKWILILALLAAFIATWLLQSWQRVEVVWVLRGLFLLTMLILFIWIQVDRSRRKYIVTNRRVIVEYGLVSKRSNEIRVQDIRSINLRRSGFPGLFGIGRVEFSSAATDDAEVIFWNAPQAERIRDLVRSLQSGSAQ